MRKGSPAVAVHRRAGPGGTVSRCVFKRRGGFPAGPLYARKLKKGTPPRRVLWGRTRKPRARNSRTRRRTKRALDRSVTVFRPIHSRASARKSAGRSVEEEGLKPRK